VFGLGDNGGRRAATLEVGGAETDHSLGSADQRRGADHGPPVGIEAHHIEEQAVGGLEAKSPQEICDQWLVGRPSQADTDAQAPVEAVGMGERRRGDVGPDH
jgi:hypothetical protein